MLNIFEVVVLLSGNFSQTDKANCINVFKILLIDENIDFAGIVQATFPVYAYPSVFYLTN